MDMCVCVCVVSGCWVGNLGRGHDFTLYIVVRTKYVHKDMTRISDSFDLVDVVERKKKTNQPGEVSV